MKDLRKIFNKDAEVKGLDVVAYGDDYALAVEPSTEKHYVGRVQGASIAWVPYNQKDVVIPDSIDLGDLGAYKIV